MSEVPLRIGDADREHAAAALGEHFATGRLSKEEYDERAQRVWEARFDRYARCHRHRADGRPAHSYRWRRPSWSG